MGLFYYFKMFPGLPL